jgi:hypothetical protein
MGHPFWRVIWNGCASLHYGRDDKGFVGILKVQRVEV